MQSDMSIIKRWIYRLRHNRGYGVQSPAAFYFVMNVLRECKHPYYMYPLIERIAKSAGDYSPKHCRRLFRIANYLQPHNMILLSAGKGASAFALTAGCRNAMSIAIGEKPEAAISQMLSTNSRYSEREGDPIEQLQTVIEQNSPIGLLYIGNTPHYNEAVEKCLPAVNKKSVIIVEGIRKNRQIKKWWQATIADKRIVVSMDLYNTGILTFNNEYKKQHYTFLFK